MVLHIVSFLSSCMLCSAKICCHMIMLKRSCTVLLHVICIVSYCLRNLQAVSLVEGVCARSVTRYVDLHEVIASNKPSKSLKHILFQILVGCPACRSFANS